jgi:hypothetical protein
VDRHPRGLQLLEVRPPGRRDREVPAPFGAAEGSRLALERPRDHPADRVLAGHRLARGHAGGDQVLLAEHVAVRGELEHRVRGGVEDDLAGLQVMRAPLLDDLGAARRRIAAEAQAGDALEGRHDVGWEAVRVRRQRGGGHDAHELPVPGRRLLARPERVQPAVDHRMLGRRYAEQWDDRAQPEPAEHREVEAADVLGQVRERVRPLVARVLAGIWKRADPAGVEHDNEGAAAHARIVAQPVARGWALKYASFRRSADRWV